MKGEKVLNVLETISLSSGLLGDILAGTVVELALNAMRDSEKSDDPIDKSKNKEEEIINFLSQHTDLLKEIAIIRRIDTAEKVSIEEFYDVSGDGGIGAQATEKSLNIGINGSGHKVTKRVYSFDGWREGSSIGIEGVMKKLLSEDSQEIDENIEEKALDTMV